MLKKLIINALDYCGGLKILRFFTQKKPIILMYHRILNNPTLPGITPEIFDRQMAYLKKHFHVMNMSMFYQKLSTNKIPNNSVVITFDDGHEDFYTTAWPIIKKHELTASLFITTAFVDQKNWLWPDLLRYILLNTKMSHFEIHNLGVFEVHKNNVLKTWNILGDHCLSLKTEARNQFLVSLIQQLDVNITNTPQMPFTSVSWQQLKEMQGQGLDVGSHSVNHPILSSLSAEELEYELAESKLRIEQELEFSPQGICYPNGMAKDVSTQVEAQASKHYQYGLVAYPAPLAKNKPMCMGRFGASNNMTDFKATVSQLTRNNNFSGEYK